MRLLIVVSLLLTGTVLSQPARGILKDTTIQGPVLQIDEDQYYGKNLDSTAFRYIYKFDGQGNILQESQFEKDDFKLRWTRKYDDNGNLLEHIRNNDFREVDKDSFAYDDQNNLIFEGKNIGASFPKTSIYRYDDEGRKIREEKYVSDNHKGTYYYNYEGDNMTMVEMLKDGNKKSIEWNVYDRLGRIKKSTKLIEKRNGNQDTCVINYSYQPNGKTTEDGCKPETERLLFNDRGQIVKEERTRKTKRGVTNSTIERSYNDQGQVIEQSFSSQPEDPDKSYSSAKSFEYVYDKYDNWTELLWYKIEDGEKEVYMKFVRDITYKE
tara:strand:+ start:78913 stop:79884 length:972 start_codon:yes stop_codon:yes gene_type:complete